jgi:hypothetical protein
MEFYILMLANLIGAAALAIGTSWPRPALC